MSVTGRRTWRTMLLVTVVAALVAAAGCGSDGDSATSSGGGSTAAAPPTTAGGSTTTAGDQLAGVPTLDALYAGTESEPPSQSPPIAKNKTIWWVSCGQTVPDCSVPAASAQEAAAKLGWKFKIADGRLNQGGGNLAAVRTAVSQSPDAIIVHGIACDIIKQGLEEAKAKKIPVIGVETLDCDDPLAAGPSATGYYDKEMKYSEKAPTTADYFQSWGKWGAAYIIRASQGKANTIVQSQTSPTLGVHINKGFQDVYKLCTACKVADTMEYVSADQTPGGPAVQRFRALLTKDTDATAVFYAVDTNVASLSMGKEAHQANPDLLQAGGSGSETSFGLIRSGTVTEITGHSWEWMGYGALDELNRIFNNQDTVPQGIGVRAVDKDHNMPPAGSGYVSPIDWKAIYTKAWKAAGAP